MTTIEAPAPPVEPSPAPSRRRGRIVALILASVLVVTAGIVMGVRAAETAADAAALNQVQVFFDSSSFKCKTSTSLITRWSGDAAKSDGNDDDYVMPTLVAGPDLDCDLSLVVENGSDRDIGVDRIAFPGLGPTSSTGARVVLAYTQGLSPYGSKQSQNAVFDYQHDPMNDGPFPVAANSTQRFDFHLTWSDGCIFSGTLDSWLDGNAQVTVSTGITSVLRPSAAPGFGIIGTRDSHPACP
jgi:hypothetical protein